MGYMGVCMCVVSCECSCCVHVRAVWEEIDSCRELGAVAPASLLKSVIIITVYNLTMLAHDAKYYVCSLPKRERKRGRERELWMGREAHVFVRSGCFSHHSQNLNSIF